MTVHGENFISNLEINAFDYLHLSIGVEIDLLTLYMKLDSLGERKTRNMMLLTVVLNISE